ncbi:MAG: hypothetical protein IKI75_04190 [Lachnospiraceae bacterium]|nr:hypothetical protein [Lachnospiraceae bacterium]
MKKRFFAIGAAALSLAALCGCGATTESVVDKMYENQAESMAMAMDVDVDVTASMSGMDVDFTASGSVDVEMDGIGSDESDAHASCDLKVSAMGSEQKVKTESYAISDDGEVTTYIKDPDSGEWTYTTAEAGENPLDEETMGKVRDEMKEVLKGAELQKKTEKAGGEDCYVLKLSDSADVFGDAIQVIWDATSDLTDEAEDAGVDMDVVKDYLSCINFDATIYASKASGRCVQLDLDLSGIDVDALKDKAEESLGDMVGSLGVDLDEIGVEISALNISITFSDWDDVEVEVPDDVIDEAVEAGFGGYDYDDEDEDEDDWTDFEEDEDPLEGMEIEEVTDDELPDDEVREPNADGSYTLYDYDDEPVVNVFPADGYEADSDNGLYSLWFTDPDTYDYYYVSTSSWESWDDVLNTGEVTEYEGDDGESYTQYVVFGDDNNVRSLIDLGTATRGTDGDWYEVYAAVDGTWDEAEGDFSSASAYIVFKYSVGDYGDNWVVVNLPGDAYNWEESEFTSFYEEIFEGV